MPMPGRSHKRSKREKIEPEEEEEEGWVCSVCTRRNVPDAFKCDTCDVRKGTSTRKPRLNSTVMEQQETIQKFVQQQQAAALAATKTNTRFKRDSFSISSSPLSSIEEHSPEPPDDADFSPSTSGQRGRPRADGGRGGPPSLKYLKRGIDTNSARTVMVTVGDVTVAITDYKMTGMDRSVSAPGGVDARPASNNPAPSPAKSDAASAT